MTKQSEVTPAWGAGSEGRKMPGRNQGLLCRRFFRPWMDIPDNDLLLVCNKWIRNSLDREGSILSAVVLDWVAIGL